MFTLRDARFCTSTIVPYRLLFLNFKLSSAKLSHFSDIWWAFGAIMCLLEPKTGGGGRRVGHFYCLIIYVVEDTGGTPSIYRKPMGPTWSRPLVFSFCPLVQLRSVKPSSLPQTDCSQPYPLTSKFQLYTYTVPKIWNIYYQKWNCAASFPISTIYIHVSGSDLYNPTIGLIWHLYFLYCVRELSGQPQKRLRW